MIEETLFAALSPLFEGRVFPDAAPFDTPRPYLIYQQVGGQAVNYLDDAVPGARNARMQLTWWCTSRGAATQLAKGIDAAMRGAAGMTARPIGAPIARHEPDLGLHGAHQDFDCWADE